MTFRAASSSLLPISLLLSLSVAAQTPPDAGVLRQQIEQQPPSVRPAPPKPRAVLPEALPAAPGMTVTVKAFRFAGNTLLTHEQLALATQPLLGQSLDFQGLQRATAAVTEAYRAAGWWVRVYLPHQEIQDGTVTLQVVEGVFGKVQIQAPQPQRLSAQIALDTIAAHQAAGQALSATALDRALLLLDDLPGVAVSSHLAPGAQHAQTDLVLQFNDDPLLSGDISTDNTGARSTGRDRKMANLVLSSPRQIGDSLSMNWTHTQGSDYGRLAYSLPVGPLGWRLGMSTSHLDYEVIAPEFIAANLHGQSSTYGLELSYPLLRSQTQNLHLNLAYDEKDYQNLDIQGVSSNYGVSNWVFGLSGNRFDDWGGGGANSASLTLSAGKVNLGNLDRSENPNLAGHFTKLRYSLSRQQTLSPTLSLYGLLSAQVADRNLDSSEKFYLGGATGVRAYPASEAGGADGRMLNLELRWRATGNLVLTGFYDWGMVRQNDNNNLANPASPNRYGIEGAGISVAWTGPRGISLKGIYARRTAHNPNANALTGADQDGTLTRDRFWLTASLPF